MTASFFERRGEEIVTVAINGFSATGRAFRFLSEEALGLQAAVYILAGSALASSLLALLRDRLLAYFFGAGTTLDLYYAAFRIPDFIFVATGALVSVYILIPELARREGEEQKRYVDTIVVGFSLLAVGVSAIAALFSPAIVPALFPRLAGDGLDGTLVLLSRIMLLQPVLLGLSNIFAAITQSRRRYLLYSISPLLYNLGIITGVVVLYPFFGITGLAWGVVLGAFLHAAIQVPSIVGDGFFKSMPRLGASRVFLETIAISVPRALALSMNQLTFVGLTALAGLLTSGSIAVFMFAYNLQAVPLAIIGASYSVAAFPTLAAAFARGERSLFIEHIASAARYVVFWSLPALALAVVLRAHIVRVVLGSGAFDWTDTRLTAAAFGLFSVSLAAQGLQLLLVRGYYAAGRTFVPFVVSLLGAAGAVGLGALFVGVFKNETALRFTQALLRVADVPGSSVLALVFAYALIAILATAFLAAHFERRFRGFVALVARSWFESVFAAGATGLAAYVALTLAGPIGFASTTLSVFTRGFVAGVCGIVAGALSYALMGNREYRETVVSIRGRLWRQAPTPAAEGALVQTAEEGTPATPQ